jgi:hypothetical protein
MGYKANYVRFVGGNYVRFVGELRTFCRTLIESMGYKAQFCSTVSPTTYILSVSYVHFVGGLYKSMGYRWCFLGDFAILLYTCLWIIFGLRTFCRNYVHFVGTTYILSEPRFYRDCSANYVHFVGTMYILSIRCLLGLFCNTPLLRWAGRRLFCLIYDGDG